MGIKIDDPIYDSKLNELDDSMRSKVNTCRDRIYGMYKLKFIVSKNKKKNFHLLTIFFHPLDLRKELDVVLNDIKSTFIEYNKLL